MSPAAPREACQSSRFRLTGQTARAEGFHEIADWFATLARAEKADAGRFCPPITAADITTDNAAYGRRRAELRQWIIPLRARRRVRLGDACCASRWETEPGPPCLTSTSTVELVVEHPECADAVPLSADLCSDLAADLGGDGS